MAPLNDLAGVNRHTVAVSRRLDELDCLRVLQALQYFSLTTPCAFALAADSPCFGRLIDEFHFGGVRRIPSGDPSPAAQIDDLLEHCVDGPSFLRESAGYLSQRLCLPRPAGCSSVVPRSFNVSRHNRLGDLLSIVWGVEEYVRRNHPSLQVTLAGAPAVAEVIKMLGCVHVRYSASVAQQSWSADQLYSLCSWRMPWMLRFSAVLSSVFGGRRGLEACPPVNGASEVPRDRPRVVGCQFDTRSGDRSLITLASAILARVAKGRPVVAIGGPDTGNYLGPQVQYLRVELKDMAAALLGLELFVACDSGVAHMAGLLRVPTIVFNFIDLDPVFNFFSGYPSTIVVDRRFIDEW